MKSEEEGSYTRGGLYTQKSEQEAKVTLDLPSVSPSEVTKGWGSPAQICLPAAPSGQPQAHSSMLSTRITIIPQTLLPLLHSLHSPLPPKLFSNMIPPLQAQKPSHCPLCPQNYTNSWLGWETTLPGASFLGGCPQLPLSQLLPPRLCTCCSFCWAAFRAYCCYIIF